MVTCHDWVMPCSDFISCANFQATLEGKAQPPAFGALVFSCNGRGVGLYGEPNYDSTTLASYVPVPLSGIFCNGVACLLSARRP
jgi:small ligand-binding sensory domain FIST